MFLMAGYTPVRVFIISITIAIMKHQYKKQIRKKRIYLAYISTLKFFTEEN